MNGARLSSGPLRFVNSAPMLTYKGFISYSHAADGQLAPAIQSSLQGYSKPWYRLRAIRLFRDKTSLSVTPALWPTIQQALDESEYFLLLASPASAESEWVRREVEYWYSHRPRENLLVIQTDGEIVRDRDTQDIDWHLTTALPPSTDGLIDKKTLVLDLRQARSKDDLSLRNHVFAEAIAKLAAVLHGRSLEEIMADDQRCRRVFARVKWLSIAGLAIMATVAAAAAYVASVQRFEAERSLASSMVANAVQLTTQGDWLRSRELAEEARLLFEMQNRDTFEIDLQVLQSYERAPAPMLSWNKSGPQVSTFEPGGKHGLALYSDRIMRADLKTMQLLDTFINAGEVELISLWFSPNGKVMLLEHADHSLTVTLAQWSSSDPRPALRLPGHGARLISAAFSQDSRSLATTAENNTTIIWDLKTRAPMHEIRDGGKIRGLAFAPDNESLITGSREGYLIRWSLATGEAIQSFTAQDSPTGWISSVAVSRNGRYLVSAGDRLDLWDLESGLPIRQFRYANSPIFQVAFSADDQRILLVGGYHDFVTEIWEVETETLVYQIAGAGQMLRNTVYSPHGAGLILNDDERNYLVLLVDDRSRIYLDVNGAHVRPLQFSPDGQVLATTGFDGSIITWDAATGYRLGGLSVEGAPVSRLRFLPDSRRVVYATRSGSVGVVDLLDKDKRVEFEAHEDQIKDLAVSSDGALAITIGADNTVKLWRITGGSLIRAVELDDVLENVAFIDDDRTALIAGREGMWAWTLSTGGLEPFSDDVNVSGWAFSVSSTGYACTSGTRMPAIFDLHYWDLTGRIKLGSFPGHGFGVSQCDLSPDGNWLVSTSFDGFMRFWEAETGRQLQAISLGDGITAVRFSPDGRNLAVGRSAGEIQIWRMSRPADYRSYAAKVESAITTLTTRPDDTVALGTLARWYAFREIWTWSIELWEKIRALGGEVSSLSLARGYWSDGRLEEAEHEFEQALSQGEAPVDYIRLCLDAIRMQRMQVSSQQNESDAAN